MRPPRSLQELPPRPAHFCLGVERFIRQHTGCEADLQFGSGDLVAACSGGADSTALTIILNCLAKRCGVRVVVVHLDHCLRPESAEDAEFVRQLCEALELELVCERLDVAALAAERGLGLEEAGREARYALLEQVRGECGAQLICTAHHLNDLAEDVLLRLARGAGWPGLGGLPCFDSRRHLLRPLLLTPKAMLLDFLRDCGVSWQQDASNVLASAARNRMRNTVLPLLIRENPNYLESVARLWRQARTDEDFWDDRLAEAEPELRGDCLFLAHGRLKSLHPAERLRLYKSLLDRLGAGQALSDALYQLDEAAMEGRDASIQFPGLKLAKVTSKGILFGPDPRASNR
ncbi:tRNA lysidine(34) synthetase TilS [Paucidesulfovibrio longus]|uniref:tRNA lysidine(34) synthetase TilS n=1 Tax=Paucidesulfovibrio longus TaxID=889 RepID=UPI000423BD7B|nr:tRNA lysidine(34) synthetase TilS [Paucidesulfovibrio longus]